MSALIAENERLTATVQELDEQNKDLREENKKLKEDGATWKHDYEVTHTACKKFELELWRYDAIIKDKEWTLQRADDCMNLAIRDVLALKREIADLKAAIKARDDEIEDLKAQTPGRIC